MKKFLDTYISYIKVAFISMSCAAFALFIASAIRQLIINLFGNSGLSINVLALFFGLLSLGITILLLQRSPVRVLSAFSSSFTGFGIDRLSAGEKGRRNRHEKTRRFVFNKSYSYSIELLIYRSALLFLLVVELIHLLSDAVRELLIK